MCGWPLWVHLRSMAADSQGQVMLLCKASGRKRPPGKLELFCTVILVIAAQVCVYMHVYVTHMYIYTYICIHIFVKIHTLYT